MSKSILTLLSLFLLSAAITAQVPFAFRYQASVRDDKNKPIIEEVEFDIQLFANTNTQEYIYSEKHTITPDANGLVAFSIGEGQSDDNFSSIVWADGPYYIQVLLDGEEISFSQLVSVPYAMHAQTAGKIHNLQAPVLPNDPTTKTYVDENYSNIADSLSLALSETKTTLSNNINSTYQASIDSFSTALNQNQNATIDSLKKALQEAISKANAYSDSLAISPKDLNVTSSGDSLVIGGEVIVISGMSSDNMPKNPRQLVLGGSYNEALVKAIHCKDDSYLFVGTTQSGNGDIKDFKGDVDIWVIKLSASFQVEWTKTLGGSRYDNPTLVIEENDGYLIGGTTESTDGDITQHNGEFDLWLTKVDASGNLLWQNTYGGAGTEFLNAIVPKGDGGYYVGATSFSNGGDISYLNGESDIWVFELDERREIIQTINIGGSRYDALNTMSYTNNELILFATSSSNDGDLLSNHGALDFMTITLNHQLEIVNQTSHGKSTNEQLQIVSPTSNGQLLAGATFAANWSIGTGKASKNIYLEHRGTNNWNKQLGGSNTDVLVDMVIINDTITLLAQSWSQDGDLSNTKGASDIWLVEIAPEGNILRNKVIGGTYDEYPKVLKALPNGGWLIGAESESLDGDVSGNAGEKDIWLVRLDKNFTIQWQKSFGGSYTEALTDIIIVDDKNIIICGTTSSNDYSITGLHGKMGKNSDIWLLPITLE